MESVSAVQSPTFVDVVTNPGIAESLWRFLGIRDITALRACCRDLRRGTEDMYTHAMSDIARQLKERGVRIYIPEEPSLLACTVVRAIQGLREPLHRAKSVEEVEFLLRAGVSPNARSDKGDTLLHTLGRGGQTESCVPFMLLRAGANPNARNLENETPLHVAVRAGDYHMASLLVAAKADPNAQNSAGETPLHLAATKSPEFVRLMLRAGARTDVRDGSFRTPLIRAALTDKEGERARLLCEVSHKLLPKTWRHETTEAYEENVRRLNALTAAASGAKGSASVETEYPAPSFCCQLLSFMSVVTIAILLGTLVTANNRSSR